MVEDPQWYDSSWLTAYFAAKDVIARVAPAKLEQFVRSFDILRTDPDYSVRHMPGLLDEARLSSIRETIKAIPKDLLEMHELANFGRFVVHNYPEFTALQATLTDFVSDLAGQEVEPCYNFLSMYSRLGICEPHLDSPTAKWTLDVCIDQSEGWPIHFSQIVPWPEERIPLSPNWREDLRSDPSLHYASQTLYPGDAILFSGSSQWHYRNKIPSSGTRPFCDLLFLHYIPKGAAELVWPRNWARLFDVPELAEIPGINEAS